VKLAASNIALPAFDHVHLLPKLRGLGIEGLEIAPSHTWHDTKPATIAAYGKAVETAGLKVVGLHSLLPDQSDLGLFKDEGTSQRTMDHLVHLSAICRDLGGKTLIWGPRWRNDLPDRAAWQKCRTFLEVLLPRMENHGTVLCFAPLGLSGGDFCATAKECYLMVNAMDHPAFGLHLGATALMESGEMGHATFAVLRGRLELFHADEPDLAELGSSGKVDHTDLRRHLAAISYFDWVSTVQRGRPGEEPLETLARGIAFAAGRYLPLDTR
jgi:sugar phosphate isomerase/epimerase